MEIVYFIEMQVPDDKDSGPMIDSSLDIVFII